MNENKLLQTWSVKVLVNAISAKGRELAWFDKKRDKERNIIEKEEAELIARLRRIIKYE